VILDERITPAQFTKISTCPNTSMAFATNASTSAWFITGASSGIGAATAKALEKQGVKVVLAGRSHDKFMYIVFIHIFRYRIQFIMTTSC
jgi:hypothetical protein